MNNQQLQADILDDCHTLSTIEAIERTNSALEGLSISEVNKRLAKYGKNALPTPKPTNIILRFLAQFSDAMVMVLIVAAFISAAIAIHSGELGELLDSAIILAIVIINAIIGLVQQDKAANAMAALKDLSKPFAKVRRDNTISKISSEHIVVGDIIVLDTGDSVPADIRLINSINLKIEEAALTGESVPSEKFTSKISELATPLGDRKNMAYSTSTVVYGRGEGVVVATGISTQVGKIATMLSKKDKDKATPLQKQLSKTAKVLSLAVLIIAAAIFIASLFNGATPIDSFLTSVAIAVAAIPEGLPAVVTIVLALGVRTMSSKRAIIRNIPSVEVLGSTQVICSDKTGTLTQNKMTITHTYAGGKSMDANATIATVTHKTLTIGMALCNDTVINGTTLIGDPTETALTAYAQKHTMLPTSTIQRIDELPFDSERKLMTVCVKDNDIRTGFTKGAADMLIKKCTHIAVNNHSTGCREQALATGDTILVRPITPSDISIIQVTCEGYANKALRVLALGLSFGSNSLEQDLVFVGLMAMIDPPRDEVHLAIQECRAANIKTVMITGDHIATASAIASSIGIEGKVTDGATVDKMDDDTLRDTIDEYGVFARVSPENKVRIVKAFKSNDKIVAMTGDGVNDAPALKTADIGIGMGLSGTDVAKGASDMVLADDNFATIVSAVKEGRRVYSNIKKAIRFLLSANIAEVLCLFFVTIFLRTTFLTPVMILWVNLVTDSLPALALGVEKAEPNIMSLPPSRQSNLLKGDIGRQIFVQGICQTILTLASFFIGLWVLPTSSHAVAMTMAFVTLCFIQLFHAYNCRAEFTSLFANNPLSNKLLNLSFAIGAALVLLIIYIQPIATVFELVMLSSTQLSLAIIFSVAIIPLVEIFKAIFKQKH